MNMVEFAVRAERFVHTMKFRMPKLISLAKAVTDLEEGTSVKYTVAKDSKVFPSKPDECEHEKQHHYRFGNQAGRFLDCRACGTGWKGPTRFRKKK